MLRERPRHRGPTVQIDSPSRVAPLSSISIEPAEVCVETHRAGTPIHDRQEHATCEQLSNDLISVRTDQLLAYVRIEPLDDRQRQRDVTLLVGH